MPAKDTYHTIVRQALINDGWKITHDPYTMEFGERGVYIDLGAEQPIAAEKEGRKIAVEIRVSAATPTFEILKTPLGSSSSTVRFYLATKLIARSIWPCRSMFLKGCCMNQLRALRWKTCNCS
jgi:hypothetical protein